MIEILKLFLTFFKIGAFTIGGGYAMLPLIQADVLKNGWLTEEEIINFIAVSESTPGPFAINIATYVGTEVSGVIGAIFATLGVVLPSFIIILIVAHFYEKFKTSKTVSGIMTGLRPCVVGLIFAALFSMAKSVFFTNGFIMSLTSPEFYISLITIITMAFLVIKKKVHPILIILISAVIGIISGYCLELI